MSDPFAERSEASGGRSKRRLAVEIVLILVVLVGVGAFILSRGDGGREDLGTEPELARELLAMEERDQEARSRATKAVILKDSDIGAEILRVDRANTKRLKEIIDEFGWPGRSLVGERASRSAWILAQHADADVGFQRQALELMEEMPEGEVIARDVAFLTDRVLVAEGKKQRYGTQLECRDGEVVGRADIADEENLDARRAEVGMEPFETYKRAWAESFGECPEDDG